MVLPLQRTSRRQTYSQPTPPPQPQPKVETLGQAPKAAPSGGVKFDLFSHEPAFGIPVLGHILNLPSALTAYIASSIPQITPPDSEAYRQATTEGALESWEEREDINPLLKLGAEIAVGAVLPPFAVVGPAKGLTRVLTSPATRGLTALGGTVKQAPIVGKLFQPSPEGRLNLLSEQLGAQIESLASRGVRPTSFVQTMEGILGGGVSDERAKATLGVGQEILNLLKSQFPKVDARAILAREGDEPAFYKAFNEAVLNSAKRELGVKQVGTVGGGLRRVTSAMREAMLSTPGTSVLNASDIAFKTQLAGVRGGVGRLIDAAVRTAKGELPPDLLAFLGPRSLAVADRALGVDITSGLLGAEAKKGLLESLSPLQAISGGALLGAVSGLPGAFVGALGGLATKYGFQANISAMRFLETIGRRLFFLDGAEKYLLNKGDEIARALSEASPTRGKAIYTALRGHNFLLSPEGVDQIARQMGASSDEVSRIGAYWRDLYDDAFKAGVSKSNAWHFPYSQDTNLIAALRAVSPFPVWPARNLPLYMVESARNPLIPATAASLYQKAEKAQEEGGLPYRFNMRLPLTEMAGGTLFINPLAPMSITTQLQEPFPSPPGETTTGFDVAQDWLSLLGLGLAPWLTYPLQVAGAIGQGQDLPDVLPWTRLLRALSQTAGVPVEPEAILRAPAEALREAVSPTATPEVGYQEYLVRKKLADMSIRYTGKPWWQVKEFADAMLDEQSDLYQQAVREVGLEQAALWAGRRALPFQPSFLSQEEELVRSERAKLPREQSSEEYIQSLETNPLAYGYRWLSLPDKELNLKVKQNFYYELPKESRDLFLAQNPDLKAYLDWSSKVRKQGRKPTITDYLKEGRR